MKVILRRVRQTPLDFLVKSDEITFKGYLVYNSSRLIALKANLNGSIITDCDVCANDFSMNINEEIDFFLHSGIYKGNNNLIDVVECMNDTADLDEILNSEIELIKSDYKCCQNCKTE